MKQTHLFWSYKILPDKPHQNIFHLTWTVICLEHQNTTKALLISALIKHLCLVLRIFKTLAHIFLILYFIYFIKLAFKSPKNYLSFLLFPLQKQHTWHLYIKSITECLTATLIFDICLQISISLYNKEVKFLIQLKKLDNKHLIFL